MGSNGSQRAPSGLAASGRALWRAITGEFELESRELAILAAACRQADDVALLEDALKSDGLIVTGSQGQPRLSGVVSELRQGRLAVSKLLAELRLPDADGRVMTPAQTRAQKASQIRWGQERAKGAG